MDLKLVAELAPEGRSELRAAIRGDGGRDAKAGDPVVDEGCGTGVSGGGGEGNGLGYREVRSMMVRRWVCPVEGGRGISRSM